ncbi:MAG: type IV toxin-antitoxin system AbiEi family antitoxin domain-containing protein [Bacteroidales bacterium]|nr:type IV toxin-antitoxin system AbiEi family antitoxin domain-containing protein [Bacteroidales bacterium]MDD4770923.1 type IV toxin-antitoxin system AbiEi family antitoxin domain-containing protein [Bacteroidales bacterium]
MDGGAKVNQSKIGKLIQEYPKGLVFLSSWLVSKGYPYELQQQYRKSGWLKSIGNGAMLKSTDPLLLSGALAALQSQANINIHLGGRSAFELKGNAHYLQYTSPEVTLFAPGKTKLPTWFTANQWDINSKVYRVSLFEKESVGLLDYQDAGITLKISGLGRAMLECLSLCPNEFPLTEAYELMEGLSTLRPQQVQILLQECKSIKAKRLFLYFAEHAGHSWLKYVDLKRIDLGSGNRSLSNDGVLIPKYHLVLPKELS